MIQSVCLVTLLSNLPPPQPSHSRTANARVLVNLFGDAIDRYKADVGDYPSESAGLGALMHDFGVRHWRGPYLPGNRPFLGRFVDPWGHRYAYRFPGTPKPEVVSYGADGKPGGTGINADVSSLDPAVVANSGSLATILRFALCAISALGFFGYPFLPAVLAKVNARVARQGR